MSKNIALLGWFGHRNVGDELMLIGLKQLFPNSNFTVMSNDNIGEYPYIDFDTINKCDLCILGGGELIHSDHLFMPTPNRFYKKSSFFYHAYARSPLGKRPWVHRIKIPKIIFGCGVNVDNASQLKTNVIKDLMQFSFIGLRDNVSFEILRSFPQLKNKVHISHDPAMAIDVSMSCEHSLNRAVIIPTYRKTYGDKGVRIHSLNSVDWLTLEWLMKNVSHYQKIIYLAFGEKDNDDYVICNHLNELNHNLSEEPAQIFNANKLTLSSILSLFGESSIVFTYRLHGLILSFLTKTPYYFYPYHWKVQRVHDTIKNLTLEKIRETQKTIVKELQ